MPSLDGSGDVPLAWQPVNGVFGRTQHETTQSANETYFHVTFSHNKRKWEL